MSIIPSRVYKALQPSLSLSIPNKTLMGPAEITLPVRECFIGKIQKGDKTIEQEIFVVDGGRNSLLGCPALEALKVVESGP